MHRAYAPALTLKAQYVNVSHVIDQCVWCSTDINAGDAVIEIGGRMMHDQPCRQEFEICVYGLEGASHTLECAENEPSDPYYSCTYAQACGVAERIVRIPVEVEL